MPNRADLQVQESDCAMCGGSGTVHNTYTRVSVFGQKCPRCDGAGVEPAEPKIHVGLLLRHPRSGKVWAVYGDYAASHAKPADGSRGWGIHRMIPSRRTRGHYVWQIRVFGERRLLQWNVVGFGDAWQHDLMEADPLGV
jgi:hypothetical protein